MSIVPQRYTPNEMITDVIFIRRKMRLAIIVFILNILLLMGLNIWEIEFDDGILNITLIATAFICLLASIVFRVFEQPQKVELKFPKVFANSNSEIH